MKYLKLYENFYEKFIHEISRRYGIQDYTINEDESIDVDEDVNLYRKRLTELPLNFRNITGFFYCDDNQLTSLKSFPKSVGGDFLCSYNKLTSLEGCPKVAGDFYCSNNQLTSLEFSPDSVGDFICLDNQLTSLKFMPKCDNFNCTNNNIRDFIGFVEPNVEFYCSGNPIYYIWRLFEDKSYIELLNDYDCIRGENIVIHRLNEFLEEIDKEPVESVKGYNNI